MESKPNFLHWIGFAVVLLGVWTILQLKIFEGFGTIFLGCGVGLLGCEYDDVKGRDGKL